MKQRVSIENKELVDIEIEIREVVGLSEVYFFPSFFGFR